MVRPGRKKRSEDRYGLRFDDSRPYRQSSNKSAGRSLAFIARKEVIEMAKNEKTSSQVASKASRLLSNPKTPAAVKSVAASALTQAANRRTSSNSRKK